MNPAFFQLAYSPWYIVLCGLVGGLYAYFLYSKKAVWGKPLNYFLASVRAILVSVLCFLFLEPSIKHVENEFEKPQFIIAVDNSTSMKYAPQFNELEQQMQNLKGKLSAKGFDIEVASIDASGSDSIQYDNSVTNFSTFFRNIKKTHKRKHLTDVLLLSDGIVNEGVAAPYIHSSYHVHTLSIGDTVQKNDVLIADIKYNRTVFKGNKFPIEVNVEAIGYLNESVQIDLLREDSLIERKKIRITAQDFLRKEIFYDEANETGVKAYSVKLSRLENEITYTNNERNLFVEVVESKEKILLYCAAPHPDVKALKSVLDRNDNYEVDLVIKSHGQKVGKEKYSLAIIHQDVNAAVIKALRLQKTPLFIVATPQTDMVALTRSNSCLSVKYSRSTDEVLPSFVSTSFDRFKIDEQIDIFNQAPPLVVPFTEYKLKPGAEVLCFQAVGNIETNRPMIVVNSGTEAKECVFVGNGLWQWRMFEYQYHQSHQVFDDFFGKLFTYISQKKDKRKFKVDLLSNQIYYNEQLSFDVAVFNDLYENIYEQKIHFKVEGDKIKKEYDFINGTSMNTFKLEKLPVGRYRYSASTTIGDEQLTVAGQFVVRDLKLEERDLVAKPQNLKALSANNRGEYIADFDEIEDFVANLQPQSKIHSKEEEKGVHRMWWLFVIIIVIATLEWSLRKYHGDY